MQPDVCNDLSKEAHTFGRRLSTWDGVWLPSEALTLM